jgi:hypothetical protein
MTKASLMLGVAAICGALFATAAQADTITFTTKQRAVIGDYVVKSAGGCPAGSTMVKEEHLLRDDSIRCVVPRGAKTVYYAPGTVIPSTVTYSELPTTVVSQLPPPPSGEVYVTADSNVYLIKPETRTVVEAVTVVGPNE